MMRISIPQPCHENWQQMQPTQAGAFCTSCAKEVVDFTQMTDEEVKNYLLQKAGQPLCGRFNSTQLHRIQIDIPSSIFQQQIARWKKYLAILLIAFGPGLFGCNVTTSKVAGEPAIVVENNTTRSIDSVATVGVLLPEIIAEVPCVEPGINPIEMGVPVPVTGDIVYVAEPVAPPVDSLLTPDSCQKTSSRIDSIASQPKDSTDCSTENYW